VIDPPHYQSWGRFPVARHKRVVELDWVPRDLLSYCDDFPLLAYGKGRSYGDVCLNDGGTLLDVSGCDRFMHLDESTCTLECEAGVTLEAIISHCLPRGLFLSVTPGTKLVTVGGAIANDVHGKNHHRAGTFGRYVRWLELMRTDGSKLVCSAEQNSDMFRATIGGLGLTGLITRASIQLKSVRSSNLLVEHRPFTTLEEFLELSQNSDKDYEYTVAWIDCMASGGDFCKGVYMRGRHLEDGRLVSEKKRRPFQIPADFPPWILNSWSLKAFNKVYFWSQGRLHEPHVSDLNSFFYPLDVIGNWNRMYGYGGFLQYQFVLPSDSGLGCLRSIMDRIAFSNRGSFLSVLKLFGELPSPGLLSFPMAGITLACDFSLRDQKVLTLLTELDRLVVQSGGRIYPAKDSRMSPQAFQASFPNWKDMLKYKDPGFSSSFWRRVTRAADTSTLGGEEFLQG
jgi:FAD/FMN-containing dehydrogenase